jgi:hypothetical protein
MYTLCLNDDNHVHEHKFKSVVAAKARVINKLNFDEPTMCHAHRQQWVLSINAKNEEMGGCRKINYNNRLQWRHHHSRAPLSSQDAIPTSVSRKRFASNSKRYVVWWWAFGCKHLPSWKSCKMTWCWVNKLCIWLLENASKKHDLLGKFNFLTTAITGCLFLSDWMLQFVHRGSQLRLVGKHLSDNLHVTRNPYHGNNCLQAIREQFKGTL